MKVWRGAGVETRGGGEKQMERQGGGQNTGEGRGDINVVITHGD